MDFLEFYHLNNNTGKPKEDTNVMLNFERELNGASRAWLQKH